MAICFRFHSNSLSSPVSSVGKAPLGAASRFELPYSKLKHYQMCYVTPSLSYAAPLSDYASSLKWTTPECMYKILYEQKEWRCATKPFKKGKIFGVIFYDYSFALVSCSIVHRSCTEVKASFKVGLKEGMTLSPLEPHFKGTVA